MDYKILFLDLDNTLLSSDLSVSEINKQALKNAAEHGVRVVICTGRGIFSVKKILTELNLDESCFTICLNGGAIYKGCPPQLVRERLFESKDASIVYEVARKYGVDMQIYRDNKLIVERLSERVQGYINKLNVEYVLVDSILDFDGKISKILLNGPHDKLIKIQKELATKITGKMNSFFSSDEYLEFTGEGTTKGDAMKELADKLGVSLSQAIAVGDSFNDMSMIKSAGLGVAVRNAVQPLKNTSDYITKNTNDEGAVAEVVDRFILKTKTVKTGEYKFRIPIQIFVIVTIIEQLIASAFNFTTFKLLKYEYVYGIGDKYRFNIISVIIPFLLCFIIDYFNQKTKGEDEEEFWESKYGKKH